MIVKVFSKGFHPDQFYLDSYQAFLYSKCLFSEGSSNGRTTGSGPVNPGSNPGPSAMKSQGIVNMIYSPFFFFEISLIFFILPLECDFTCIILVIINFLPLLLRWYGDNFYLVIPYT